MFDLEPRLDKIVVVLTAGMAGLAGGMTRARGWQVGHVYNLTVGGNGDDSFRLVGQCGSHAHCIDIAAKGIGATIEDFIERLDHAERMAIGHSHRAVRVNE